MKASRSWKTIAGWVLHGLVGGIMLLAGSAKVLGLFPPEQVEKLGLSVPIQVIGAGELVSAILLLVPRTSSLVVLLLTWVGAYLRVPGTFASFAVSSLTERPVANATKDLVV